MISDRSSGDRGRELVDERQQSKRPPSAVTLGVADEEVYIYSVTVPRKMLIINRAAIILKPKQPYLDWIASLEPDEAPTDEHEEREFPVYLLPEVDDDEGLERILKDRYTAMFENELKAWWQNTADWPQNRDYKMFRDWFLIEFGSEVFDLGNGAIRREEG